MSAGGFEQGFYEADSAEIHIVRFQPETEALDFGGTMNAQPEGPATSPFWVKVSRATTEYGLAPRKVRIKWTGDPPTGYLANQSLEVMVFQASVFNGVTLNSTCTYLGSEARVVGKIGENQYPGI